MISKLIRTGCGIGFLRYRNDPAFSYYRLKNPAYSYNCIVAEPAHVFSEPERYLIYLMNKYIVLGDGVRIMTDTLMNIIREFSPGDYMPEELQ